MFLLGICMTALDSHIPHQAWRFPSALWVTSLPMKMSHPGCQTMEVETVFTSMVKLWKSQAWLILYMSWAKQQQKFNLHLHCLLTKEWHSNKQDTQWWSWQVHDLVLHSLRLSLHVIPKNCIQRDWRDPPPLTLLNKEFLPVPGYLFLLLFVKQEHFGYKSIK